jgi:hypothetical protein
VEKVLGGQQYDVNSLSDWADEISRSGVSALASQYKGFRYAGTNPAKTFRRNSAVDHSASNVVHSHGVHRAEDGRGPITELGGVLGHGCGREPDHPVGEPVHVLHDDSVCIRDKLSRPWMDRF